MKKIINLLPKEISQKLKGLKDKIIKSALINEVRKLPVIQSGISEDGFPWIRLSGGLIFYGFLTLPHDRVLYHYIDKQLKEKIIEDTFGVALDIVTRYYYPHALPALTPPYNLFARKGFHPQHEDTIRDIPKISSAMKERLSDLFTVKEGDTFVDVGAFMGYGALKIANIVNNTGKVIAIEADPDCRRLLERNVNENHVRNIMIVPKAAWNKKEVLTFNRRSKQTNSLIPLEHIVDRDTNNIEVPTDTLDNILNDIGITEVSLISLTINGAEIEAIEGMSKTLDACAPRLSIAGWFCRDTQPVWKSIVPMLKKKGYTCVVGNKGRVYAWKGKP